MGEGGGWRVEGEWHLDVGEEDLGIARGDFAVVEKAAVVVSAQIVTKTHCGKGVTHTMSSAMLQASSSPASVSCTDLMKACRTKEGRTMHLLRDGERGGDERRNVLQIVFFVPHDDGLNCLGGQVLMHAVRLQRRFELPAARPCARACERARGWPIESGRWRRDAAA